MAARKALALFAALGTGLAGIAAPVPFLSATAQAQQAPPPAQGVLPADPQDFQCFVMLQQRRNTFLANQQMDAAARAEVVNNLTIISAYYAGRISHYSSAEAIAQYRSANAAVAAATPEQQDEFANVCANFYLTVMNVLATTGEQAATPQ
ncbi:MAG: hypothetical protein JY451_14590 [Erythrobacter sp.]|nr:MAG: hypothetical protein JY451_14590 [Erythrobacter sp.]